MKKFIKFNGSENCCTIKQLKENGNIEQPHPKLKKDNELFFTLLMLQFNLKAQTLVDHLQTPPGSDNHP